MECQILAPVHRLNCGDSLVINCLLIDQHSSLDATWRIDDDTILQTFPEPVAGRLCCLDPAAMTR